MVFRHRGLKVVVDTTETAEFDIKSFQLSDDLLTVFENSFITVPFSQTDVVHGDVRARVIDGYDLFFIVGRDDAELVVTIGGVQPHNGEDALQQAVRLAEKIGSFRGVTGL